MDVLPHIGLPGGDAAPLVPLKKEFDSIEDALIKDASGKRLLFRWDDAYCLRRLFFWASVIRSVTYA